MPERQNSPTPRRVFGLLVTCCLVLFILPAQAAVPARQNTININWSANPFHSLFYSIDQLSGWQDDAYSQAWRRKWVFQTGDRDLLLRYRSIRQRYSKELYPVGQSSDKAYPVGPFLLPQSEIRAEQSFTLAFLTAKNLSEAFNHLNPRLESHERELLEEVFQHFETRIYPLVQAYLPQARQQLQEMAKQSNTQGYLQKMADFYQVEVPEQLEIVLLWSPPGLFKATVIKGLTIIPFPESESSQRDKLAFINGVIIHELGHDFVSRLALDLRQKIGTEIIEANGFINAGHPNILDEATQTAFGNILYTQKFFPLTYLPEAHFYRYEKNEEYPFAIDALARRLAPILEAHLRQEKRFYPDYVRRALKTQQELIPPQPRHFARLALLYGNPQAREILQSVIDHRSWVAELQTEPIINELKQYPHRSAILLAITPEEHRALKTILNTLKHQNCGKGFCIFPRPEQGYLFILQAQSYAELRELIHSLYLETKLPIHIKPQ